MKKKDVDQLYKNLGKEPPELSPRVRTIDTGRSGGDEAKAKIHFYLIDKFGKDSVLTEHRFSERRFRFDFAIPSKMIAVEYEGLMSEKSGHTTETGYTKDTDKYNLATKLGWQVYRFTILNYNTINDYL